jgi:hypothetical protein
MKTFTITCLVLVSLAGASGLTLFTYAIWTAMPWHPLTIAFTLGCGFTSFWHLKDARKSIKEIKAWNP